MRAVAAGLVLDYRFISNKCPSNGYGGWRGLNLNHHVSPILPVVVFIKDLVPKANSVVSNFGSRSEVVWPDLGHRTNVKKLFSVLRYELRQSYRHLPGSARLAALARARSVEEKHPAHYFYIFTGSSNKWCLYLKLKRNIFLSL